MAHVALQIKKKPEDVEKFVVILEENWIETVAAMKQMEDDQWKSLNIPMGLANQIKGQLAKIGEKGDSEMAFEENQIDSGASQATKGRQG